MDETDYRIVSGDQIRDITADGLVYLDENGDTVFIDFSVCYENYMRRFMNPQSLDRIKEVNHLDDEGMKKLIERRKDWKEVASRNVLTPPWADGPYIEFHAEPPIRFEFTTKDEFWKVRSTIEQFGWKTFDLS